MGKVSMVKLLLDRDADPNWMNKHGSTAFHYACVKDLQCAEELFYRCDAAQENHEGKTGEDIAQDRGLTDIVARIVKLSKARAKNARKREKQRLRSGGAQDLVMTPP